MTEMKDDERLKLVALALHAAIQRISSCRSLGLRLTRLQQIKELSRSDDPGATVGSER